MWLLAARNFHKQTLISSKMVLHNTNYSIPLTHFSHVDTFPILYCDCVSNFPTKICICKNYFYFVVWKLLMIHISLLSELLFSYYYYYSVQVFHLNKHFITFLFVTLTNENENNTLNVSGNTKKNVTLFRYKFYRSLYLLIVFD